MSDDKLKDKAAADAKAASDKAASDKASETKAASDDKPKDKTKAVEAAAPEATLVAARPAPVPLAEDRWKLKEHMNPGNWICVAHATTIEDLHQPVFWANVARHLRPSCTVEVHWDDASQFAEVYVLSCGRNWASVSLLRHRVLEKPLLPQQSHQYGVAYNGPVDKFRLTRLSDGAVIRAGFATEADALKYRDEYLRKLAA